MPLKIQLIGIWKIKIGGGELFPGTIKNIIKNNTVHKQI